MKTPWLPRLGAILTVLALSATPAQAQGALLLVSNVQAQQRPLTAIWDVTYDLDAVGGVAATVSLFLSTDWGASHPNLCTTVSGDIGAGVTPGTGKHIVWDAGADYPGLISEACQLRVTADDGQVGTPAGFVAIEPGTFLMGSPTYESLRSTDETEHQVTLTHGLYVQVVEVTNQQYMDLAQWAYDQGYVTATSAGLGDNLDGSTVKLKTMSPDSYEISFNEGVFSCLNPDHPVTYVTWYGAAAYCDWLSLQQGLPRAYNHATWQCNAGNPYSAAGYRLPTEAEWEYACRAGTQSPFSTGFCLEAGSDANHDGGFPYTGCSPGPIVGGSVPVANFPANVFGLYDMHGNLLELCNDWYGAYGGSATNPVGGGAGTYRVSRGGHWDSYAGGCRSAARRLHNPALARNGTGFRPVRSAN